MKQSKFFTKSRTISLLTACIIMMISLPGIVSAYSDTDYDITNAIYISDTIPPTMNAGQSYTVSVTIRNTGRLVWNEGNMINLGGVGDNTGEARKFGPTRISIP